MNVPAMRPIDPVRFLGRRDADKLTSLIVAARNEDRSAQTRLGAVLEQMQSLSNLASAARNLIGKFRALHETMAGELSSDILTLL
jgi:hypothetical protein